MNQVKPLAYQMRKVRVDWELQGKASSSVVTYKFQIIQSSSKTSRPTTQDIDFVLYLTSAMTVGFLKEF